MSRLNWKNNIILHMSLSPIPLLQGDLSQSAYRRVEVMGVFNISKAFYVFAGKRGYYFLQPLLIGENDYILVNRGIVDKKDGLDKEDISNEKINVSGVLYCDHASKRINRVVKNDPETNTWFSFDLKAMSRQSGLLLKECFIWSDKTLSINKKIIPNKELKVRNNHFGYALTWYVSALIWIAGCFYFCRKNKKTLL